LKEEQPKKIEVLERARCTGSKKDLTWLQEFVTSLADREFYGTLELSFQRGRITGWKKVESGRV